MHHAKDYLISSVGTLLYDWPKTNFAHWSASRNRSMKQQSTRQSSPATDTHFHGVFHYLLVGAAFNFLSQLLAPEEIC